MAKQIPDDQVYVSIAEISRMLGVTPQTVYNWRKANKMPPPVGHASSTHYKKEDIEMFDRYCRDMRIFSIAMFYKRHYPKQFAQSLGDLDMLSMACGRVPDDVNKVPEERKPAEVPS